jgi:hypothetical protein
MADYIHVYTWNLEGPAQLYLFRSQCLDRID